MSTVFVSYRQTDAPQVQRVRTFAERLRDCGVDVVLDQFLLDEHPAGPNEGWDKWSSDRALQSEYVLIVGTQDWFECFDKTQPRGTGLGAACEADDLRERIYEAGGINASIRVVLFDDADGDRIPGKLRRYHRFHAERDFANIARWLGGRVQGGGGSTASTPHTRMPHNLPALQPFFGRKDELEKIAEALDPESRTWGASIDGPGGMGKTSLAVRAAYDASPEDFDRIVFVSLKSRELDDDGLRDLSGFLIGGLAELLNELAREIGREDIATQPEERRPLLLHEALRDTRALLVLDNLESLTKAERDTVFTLVKRLPQGCKAILTSRVRIGSAAEELILDKLSEAAALETLAKLADGNPGLAKTDETERLKLYRETGGKPLLLRWTAGQIGRGSCLTLSDALSYLRSCPVGNDPLEFVFGDLVDNFSEAEARALCALTYFTLPVKVEQIAELSEFSGDDTDRALRSLTNRALVVPSDELKAFTLVPFVADLLRKKGPDVVADAGVRLEQYAHELVVENGFKKYDRFPILTDAWPSVAAALPLFLVGPNERLQTICGAIKDFLDFTGRWDELLALSRDAERRALGENDYLQAGWRVHDAGRIHYLRGEATPALTCADRAENHWQHADTSAREKASAIRLRGWVHNLQSNQRGAITAFREAVELARTLGAESELLAACLNALAGAEGRSGELEAAESNYREALRIATAIGHGEMAAGIPANLAQLALDRKDWATAEAVARDALPRAESVGRIEVIAAGCASLAVALARQDRKVEALPYARRAVELLGRLRSPGLAAARELLAECER